MQILMRYIQLCAVVLTIISLCAHGLMSTTGRRMTTPRNILVMSSGKTPLVANGKRFEADSGSSLIVVSPLYCSQEILKSTIS